MGRSQQNLSQRASDRLSSHSNQQNPNNKSYNSSYSNKPTYPTNQVRQDNQTVYGKNQKLLKQNSQQQKIQLKIQNIDKTLILKIALDAQVVFQQSGAKYFQEFFVDVEETVYYTQIQYPTFPEILALCNSTLSLLMCLGFFGRQMAQKLIRQELFLLILQNFYQGTYEKVLRIHKFIQPNEQDYPKKTHYLSESIDLQENSNPITVPNIHTNSRQNQFTQQDTNQQQIQDAVLEDASVGEGQSPVIIPEINIKTSGQIINQLDLVSDTKRDKITDQETIFSSRNQMYKLSDEENKILDLIKSEETSINKNSQQINQEFRLQAINPNYSEEKQILKINMLQPNLSDQKNNQKTVYKRTSITKNLFERRQMQPLVSQIVINSCDRTENNLKFDASPLKKFSSVQENLKNDNPTKINPPKIPSIQQHENFNNQCEKSPNSSLESKLKSINNQSIFKKYIQEERVIITVRNRLRDSTLY
ncbi:hypothetical protein ABPG74_001390 [Tetrahymena malaccensis]